MSIYQTPAGRKQFLAALVLVGMMWLPGAIALGQDTADKAATQSATSDATPSAEQPAADANKDNAATSATTSPAQPAAGSTDEAAKGAADDSVAAGKGESKTGDTGPALTEGAGGGAQDAAAPSGNFISRSLLVQLLLVIALFVLSIMGGNWIARNLRMPDYGWKISLILFVIGASALIVSLGTFKFGPDLAGGITLIYERADSAQAAEPEPAPGGGTATPKDQAARARKADNTLLITALKQRIDPTSTQEITIRPQGESLIEIIIPKTGEDALEYVKRRITELGQLEFRITADPTQKNDRPIIEQAKLLTPNQKDVYLGGNKVAEWVAYDTDPRAFGPADREDSRLVKRMAGDTPEGLVLIDPMNVTGEYLTSATKGVDERGGPSVNFSFNHLGAARFGQLTSANKPNSATGAVRYLGILLDKRLISAPSIRSTIREHGQISGGSMDNKEVEFIISILNAGSLPAALNKQPISEKHISPTLGAENIKKGQQAVVVSFVAIVLFMMFYYRLAGVISVLALFVNLLVVLAVMILIKAAFTLPGLAGLVLTIGIAVDANVLIFERIREELRNGAALRMAIRNGFERATRTIIDANMTTIISAMVMYVVGRDQIKGFAVTLILGILVSMFTAIFCSRIVFDILERRGWITTLKMRSVIGKTNIDFMGWQYWAIGISWALIAIGFVAIYARGTGLFNIDFTGGSSVTFVLDENHRKPVADVEAALDNTELLHQSLVVVRNGETDTRYTVNTSEQSVEKVKEIVEKAFHDELKNYSLVFRDVKPFAEGDLKGTETTVVFNSGPGYDKEDGVSHDALLDHLRTALAKSGQTGVVVTVTNPNYRTGSAVRYKEWQVRLAGLEPDATQNLLAGLKTNMEGTPMFPLANKIGGRVSTNLQLQALYAIGMSCLGIILYLWLRFQKVSFGLAAVIALLHDVFFTVGAVALSYYFVQWLPGLSRLLKIESFQISLDIVAALLTIIGYSVNDTIIVFDRLREVRGKSPELTVDMINASVNQTLGRTLLTAFAVFLVVVILYFLGGEGIHGFAFCMVVGVFVGCYSSIYIASPILYWLSGSKSAAGAGGTRLAADRSERRGYSPT